MRVPPRFVAWVLGLSVWLAALPARAWVETRFVSAEVGLEIDRSSSAVIEQRITVLVRGGPLKSIDLASADKDVTPLESTVAPEGVPGTSMPLELVPRPSGGLKVNVISPRGLSRGTFVFRVRYRRALVPGEDLGRDGAMVRLRWTDASWTEGRDNVRCTIILPSAPTEPRAPTLPSSGDRVSPFDITDGVFIAETKRAADHDEVTLVRPHVARGEAVTWTVYVDPRALAPVSDAAPKPVAAAKPRPEIPTPERAAYVFAGAVLLFGFSLLVGAKARQVARHCSGIAKPRAIVPLPTPLRVLLAGPTLVAGVAMQLRLDDPWWGTLAVLAALLVAGYRRPIWERVPRGPGKWLLLADGEAFTAPSSMNGAWLDGGTRTGRVAFLVAFAAIGIATYFLGRVSTFHAYLVAFDAAVLVPIFGTGRLADLPPHPIEGAGPRLGRIARSLRSKAGIRAVAWARLPDGGHAFDELRLLCTPRVPLRGFVGIEVGLVAVLGTGGFFYVPELLIRVLDASPCHDAFRALRPGARWVRGRRAEERVMRIAPRLPTMTMTAALALRLLEQARDLAPPTIARGEASTASPRRGSAAQRAGGRSVPNSANAGNAATRSAGSGECASSAGTTSSPLQPT